MDNKGFGKIIVVIGIALQLLGIGVAIYSNMFSTSEYYGNFPNFITNGVPIWFANVIAVTFIILGFVLIVLGARELGFHNFDSDAKTSNQKVLAYVAMFKSLKSALYETENSWTEYLQA